MIAARCAKTQTGINQAVIACALERYRLVHGEFPDKLESLEPDFINHLPPDVVTGQPMKYHRISDGQFLLYSVGWDEKDDGGKFPVPIKTHTRQSLHWDGIRESGDWVWRYPARP